MDNKSGLVELVFSNPTRAKGEPFTTSEILAQGAGVQHAAIQRLIRKHKKDLSTFGQVGFQIRAVEKERGVKYEKIYELNEQQATLLITYLKNTQPVREFKQKLVQQFYAMRDELIKRDIAHEQKKPVRRSLTDTLRNSGEDERMHGKSWGTYTSMIYKTAIGKTVKELRQERANGAKINALELMTASEIQQVQAQENRVMVLLELGLQYDEIKRLITGTTATTTKRKGNTYGT